MQASTPSSRPALSAPTRLQPGTTPPPRRPLGGQTERRSCERFAAPWPIARFSGFAVSRARRGDHGGDQHPLTLVRYGGMVSAVQAAEHCRSNFAGRRESTLRPSFRLSTWPYHGMANALFSVTIALAGIGLAATAPADPSTFNNLSCSCQSPPDLGPAKSDQIARGIRDGLSFPQAARWRSGI